MNNNPIFNGLIDKGCRTEGDIHIWSVDDSKLWYLKPEQAKGYLDYLNEEGYQGGKKELELIDRHMAEITSGLEKQLNIVDLGCGDGRKAMPLIKFLSKKTTVRYCPIDISSHMVECASENIKRLNVEVLKELWSTSDFEHLDKIAPYLRTNGFKRSLFMLMGNTVGNYETDKLLEGIAKGMETRDLLLIGSGLNNGKLDEESVAQLKKSKISAQFFSYITAQIGLDINDLEYDVRFRNPRLEFFYRIKNDRTVSSEKGRINFKKGDQIVVAFCYQYNIENLVNHLKRHFKNTRTYPTEDGSYTLAVCHK